MADGGSDWGGYEEKLKAVASALRAGEEVPPITVRTFLHWFFAQRRTSNTVWWIGEKLNELNLRTEPDFNTTWLDGLIELQLADSDELATNAFEAVAAVEADPTYRIGKLECANTPPTCVAPTQTVTEAVTLMLVNDFSQLPVMTGERDVKGIISWTSIGSRLARGLRSAIVADCMEIHHEVSADASLFEAIDAIVRNQYVLIRDATQKISGIVTTSDLAEQFRQLTEPFLLLGEIENHIRQIILRGQFSSAQLSECRDPNDQSREIDGVADLTFGDYIRLLERPESWSQVRLAVDRRIFIERLDKVRQIRNDVMHFDPDGISDDDLTALRKFTGFLRKLVPTGRDRAS